MTADVVLMLRPCRLVPVTWCDRCGGDMPADHVCPTSQKKEETTGE